MHPREMWARRMYRATGTLSQFSELLPFSLMRWHLDFF